MLGTKIYHFMEICIRWTSVLLTGILFVSAFLRTAYAEDMNTQVALLKNDNLLVSLVVITAVMIAAVVHYKVLKRNFAKNKRRLLWITLAWYFGLGVFLSIFGRTVPAADAMSVYQMGSSLAKGDLAIIHPTDSYLSYYPQQLGLAVFMGIMIFVIDLLPITLQAYHFIKIAYVFLLCTILIFSYLIVEKVWENDGISCTFLLLSIVNFPLILFSNFLYGEIPGYCFFVISIYFLVLCFKKEESFWTNGLLSILFMTISVWLRKNMLIMLIAVFIVLAAQWLRTRHIKWGALGLVMVLCSLSISPAIEKSFENMAGREVKSGVTAMSYLAMGMQEAGRGPGWYNGFNFNTYQESGMDSEVSNQVSRQVIEERMTYFMENPAYAGDFYARKYLTQWTDGTYAVRQAVLADFGGRLPLIQEIYSGKYSPVFIAVCNQLQNLVYLGSFLWSILMCKKSSKKKEVLPLYLGIIIVIGGLLFHMLWEANSRYIVLFGQVLYFYAAAGWYMCCNKLSGRSRK